MARFGVRGGIATALLAASGLGTAGILAVRDDSPAVEVAALDISTVVAFYQVESGDTWSNIAARFNLNGTQLAIQNGNTPSTQPRVGRVLLIIPGPPPPSTTTQPPTTTVVPTTVVPTTSSPTSTTVASTTTVAGTTTSTSSTTTTIPPSGRFVTLPVGATLPSEGNCASRVRRMTENRPENATYNATRGTVANDRFPRATGNFVGTTDEILQWVACKWGIDEDQVRAQVTRESFWRQPALGDFTTDPNACIPGFPIGNYPPQFSGDNAHNGQCPESIGLMQDRWLYHQEAFQDSNAVRSSAYNVDYAFAHWRACFEGGFTWLNTVERGRDYAAGDLQGCQGVWFSGRWYTQPGTQYMAEVAAHFTNKPWLGSGFPPAQPTTTPPTTTTTAPGTTTTSTTTPPTTTTPPAGGFFADFNNDGQFVGEFRHDLWRRDNVLVQQTQWNGDHNLMCSPPNLKRVIHRSTIAESFYECADHVMISEGDTSGYSIAWVSPDRVFNMAGASSVCWKVNLTDMGTRQWFEVGVIPADASDLFVESSIASAVNDNPEVVVYPRANYAVALWSGPSAWLGKLGINGNVNQFNQFDANSDVATRYPMCFTDNGAGTLNVTIFDPITNAPILSHSRPGAFPTIPSKVMFAFKYYTPTKDGAVISTTWHLDDVRVTQ